MTLLTLIKARTENWSSLTSQGDSEFKCQTRTPSRVNLALMPLFWLLVSKMDNWKSFQPCWATHFTLWSTKTCSSPSRALLGNLRSLKSSLSRNCLDPVSTAVLSDGLQICIIKQNESAWTATTPTLLSTTLSMVLDLLLLATYHKSKSTMMKLTRKSSKSVTLTTGVTSLRSLLASSIQ